MGPTGKQIAFVAASRAIMAFDPDQPRDDEGQFVKWTKGKPGTSKEGLHTVTHGSEQYDVYYDKQSASWRSEALLTAPRYGADFLGFNKKDVEEKIKSGSLKQRIAEFFKSKRA